MLAGGNDNIEADGPNNSPCPDPGTP